MSAPILVTGGAGFLGGWVVRGLLERGAAVRVFDLPRARWTQFAGQSIDPVHGDIRDRPAVAAALRGCHGVIHVAGLPQLWSRPRGRFTQINFHGAVHVLEEAIAAGCRRIVHVSSATIWPLHDELVCRWHDAVGAYGRSKLLAERHALRLARGGAPIVIVSPTAPLGPGDWSRTPPTQMALEVCQGKRREYVPARLNVVDVRDAAAAMIGALDVGIPGERYLLGHTTMSLQELFARMTALTGQAAPQRRVPYWLALLAGIGMEAWADIVSRRNPPACVAAVQLTRRPPPQHGGDLHRLGVTPRTLEQTLADTVAWFRAVNWLDRD